MSEGLYLFPAAMLAGREVHCKRKIYESTHLHSSKILADHLFSFRFIGDAKAEINRTVEVTLSKFLQASHN